LRQHPGAGSKRIVAQLDFNHNSNKTQNLLSKNPRTSPFNLDLPTASWFLDVIILTQRILCVNYNPGHTLGLEKEGLK
jgi:hypothetical protein